jgi:hypothetical protein
MFTNTFEQEQAFCWNNTTATSLGGCATVYSQRQSTSLFIKVVKTCQYHNLELIVTAQEDWRKHQIAGYIYNGTVYSSYGKYEGTSTTWNKPGDLCGVVVDYAKKSGMFNCGGSYVHFSLPNDVKQGELLLGVRVHQYGAVEIVTK